MSLIKITICALLTVCFTHFCLGQSASKTIDIQLENSPRAGDVQVSSNVAFVAIRKENGDLVALKSVDLLTGEVNIPYTNNPKSTVNWTVDRNENAYILVEDSVKELNSVLTVSKDGVTSVLPLGNFIPCSGANSCGIGVSPDRTKLVVVKTHPYNDLLIVDLKNGNSFFADKNNYNFISSLRSRENTDHQFSWDSSALLTVGFTLKDFGGYYSLDLSTGTAKFVQAYRFPKSFYTFGNRKIISFNDESNYYGTTIETYDLATNQTLSKGPRLAPRSFGAPTAYVHEKGVIYRTISGSCPTIGRPEVLINHNVETYQTIEIQLETKFSLQSFNADWAIGYTFKNGDKICGEGGLISIYKLNWK